MTFVLFIENSRGVAGRKLGLHKRVGVVLIRKSTLAHDRNLVDPASSHMLVSKIKPCMSQNKSLHDESANGSLKQFYSTP